MNLVYGGFVEKAKIRIENGDLKTVYYPHLQKKRKKRRYLPFFLRKKFIATLMLICMLSFYFISMVTSPSTVFAEDDNIDYSEVMVRMMYAPFSKITEEYAIYQGEYNGSPISFYYIDAITNVEIEEHEEWLNIIPSWLESPFKTIEGALQRYINGINNLLFEMNMYLSTALISVIGFAFEFDIIQKMLRVVEPSVISMVGISNGQFVGGLGTDGGGLFGVFLEVIFMMMIIMVIYNMVVNRKLLGSLNVILRVVLSLTIALLFFSNYSTVLSSLHEIAKNTTSIVVNDIGDGITQGIANVTSDTSTDSFVSGLFASDDLVAKGNEGKPMKRLIWNIFVERPYAYSQFGSADIGNTLSKERFEDMLSYIPNTEERASYLIETEIQDNKNAMVHADQVFKKMGFLGVVLMVNTLTAIPIFLVALAIVLLQFWYIIVAILAPFALLLGAIPTMHKVLLRYGLELVIPLFLRIFLTTLLLLLLALTSLSFEFAQAMGSTEEGTPFFISYFATAIFIFMLFIMTFLLRNRLKDIFSKGSSFLGELRNATGDMTDIMSGGFRSATTGAGAVVGAVTAGLATGGAGVMAGAMKGANMGKAVGNLGTGNGDLVGTATKLYQLNQMDNLSKNKGNNKNEENVFAGAVKGSDYIANDGKNSTSIEKSTSEELNKGNNSSQILLEDSGIIYNATDSRKGLGKEDIIEAEYVELKNLEEGHGSESHTIQDDLNNDSDKQESQQLASLENLDESEQGEQTSNQFEENGSETATEDTSKVNTIDRVSQTSPPQHLPITDNKDGVPKKDNEKDEKDSLAQLEDSNKDTKVKTSQKDIRVNENENNSTNPHVQSENTIDPNKFTNDSGIMESEVASTDDKKTTVAHDLNEKNVESSAITSNKLEPSSTEIQGSELNGNPTVEQNVNGTSLDGSTIENNEVHEGQILQDGLEPLSSEGNELNGNPTVGQNVSSTSLDGSTFEDNEIHGGQISPNKAQEGSTESSEINNGDMSNTSIVKSTPVSGASIISNESLSNEIKPNDMTGQNVGSKEVKPNDTTSNRMTSNEIKSTEIENRSQDNVTVIKGSPNSSNLNNNSNSNKAQIDRDKQVPKTTKDQSNPKNPKIQPPKEDVQNSDQIGHGSLDNQSSLNNLENDINTGED